MSMKILLVNVRLLTSQLSVAVALMYTNVREISVLSAAQHVLVGNIVMALLPSIVLYEPLQVASTTCGTVSYGRGKICMIAVTSLLIISCSTYSTRYSKGKCSLA